MRRTSFAEMDCSIALTLEAVGEWWTLLIVRDLFLGVRRFEDFRRRLGIPRNILSDRLAKLIAAGMVHAVPYQDHPPRREYRLTEMGLDLYPVVVTLRQFGDRWLQPGDPPVVVEHQACGQAATAVLTCAGCGGPVTARTVRARGGVVPARPEQPIPVT